MTSSEPNVARLPVELAQPRVQLGRHDRHQDEVVEADREVERRQPRDRDRDQDRDLDERARRRGSAGSSSARAATSSPASTITTIGRLRQRARPRRARRDRTAPASTRQPSSTSSVATEPGSRAACSGSAQITTARTARVISVTDARRVKSSRAPYGARPALAAYRASIRAIAMPPGTCKNWSWMEEFHCSFCGKQRREVRKLISRPARLHLRRVRDSVQRHPRQGRGVGAPEVPAARGRSSRSSTATSSARSDAKRALVGRGLQPLQAHRPARQGRPTSSSRRATSS